MITLFLSDMELDRLEEILDPDDWDLATALETLGITAVPDRVEQQLKRRHGQRLDASLYVDRDTTITQKMAMLYGIPEWAIPL